MDTIDRIALLNEQRAEAVALQNELDKELLRIKTQLESAQNIGHQTRLHAKHKQVLAYRFDHQTVLTRLNAQIRSANAELQRELRAAAIRRNEVQ